ncbi:MAG: hypothetical protein ACRCTE_13835 [Cellulosilyticaceae bacterium]
MEKQILQLLKEIKTELVEHRAILNEHSAILNRHDEKLDEHGHILRALEHSSQVSRAQQDAMANDIAHIKGDMAALHKEIGNVEIITASNWSDIAKLKAIK